MSPCVVWRTAVAVTSVMDRLWHRRAGPPAPAGGPRRWRTGLSEASPSSARHPHRTFRWRAADSMGGCSYPRRRSRRATDDAEERTDGLAQEAGEAVEEGRPASLGRQQALLTRANSVARDAIPHAQRLAKGTLDSEDPPARAPSSRRRSHRSSARPARPRVRTPHRPARTRSPACCFRPPRRAGPRRSLSSQEAGEPFGPPDSGHRSRARRSPIGLTR